MGRLFYYHFHSSCERHEGWDFHSSASQIVHQFLLAPVDSGISFTIEFPELFDIGRQRIQLFLQLGRISIPGHFLYSSLQGLGLLHQLVVLAEQDFYLLLVRQVFVHFMHKHFYFRIPGIHLFKSGLINRRTLLLALLIITFSLCFSRTKGNCASILP